MSVVRDHRRSQRGYAKPVGDQRPEDVGGALSAMEPYEMETVTLASIVSFILLSRKTKTAVQRDVKPSRLGTRGTCV